MTNVLLNALLFQMLIYKMGKMDTAYVKMDMDGFQERIIMVIVILVMSSSQDALNVMMMIVYLA